jgi:hypothetical protein
MPRLHEGDLPNSRQETALRVENKYLENLIETNVTRMFRDALSAEYYHLAVKQDLCLRLQRQGYLLPRDGYDAAKWPAEPKSGALTPRRPRGRFRP